MLPVARALTGCQSPKAAHPFESNAAQQATRSDCYRWLHHLLNEQKDIGALRLIEREHSDVQNLIKTIATFSGAGSKLLEEVAKLDPSIDLDGIRLQLGEAALSGGIASTKEKQLSSQTGDDFELTLLLSQTETLSNAWHLAKVAGENESQPDRTRALAGISEDMRNLHQEVFVMLLAKAKSLARDWAGRLGA